MFNVCGGMVISAAAAGCSTNGTVTRPVAPALVADEQALALPPPGGPAVIGVVERKRGNGIEQTVSLATTARVPGQNYLKIEFYGPQVSRGPSASFKTVNEREILREAALAVPGVRLSRRSTFLQNSYGPFAFAAGRSSLGDTCIYAWQQIRAGTAGSGIGRNFGMIQVRWRLCDSYASEQQLLSAVYGYTITGTFDGKAWNPFREPGSADPRLGKTGFPIYPATGNPTGGVSMGYAGGIEVARAVSVVRRPVPKTIQSAQPVARVENPVTGPRVPRPDGLTTTTPAAASSQSASGAQAPRGAAVTVPSPENF